MQIGQTMRRAREIATGDSGGAKRDNKL